MLRLASLCVCICILVSYNVHAQDSFWSSTTSTSAKPLGNNQFFYSQVAGVYGMRPLESIDLGKPTDLKSQKTEFDKLIEQGKKELGNLVKQELKNYIKKEVGKELGKELGNQAGQAFGAAWNAFADAAAKKKAEEEERQRLYLLEQERLKRVAIKSNLRKEFYGLLKDSNIPIVAPQAENFFFIINQETDSTLSVSLFSVFANASNQLPYKVEMIKAYQKELGTSKNWLYGPFKSRLDAQNDINELALSAFAGFFELTEDKYFVHGGAAAGQTQATVVDDGDFWGTGKTTAPATTSDSFWGETKKN